MILYFNRFIQCIQIIFGKKTLIIITTNILLFNILNQNIKNVHNKFPVQMSSCTLTESGIEIQTDNFMFAMFSQPEEEISQIYSSLRIGGRKRVSNNDKYTAIIVPYRDRSLHLSAFLRHMHYFLHKQPINYGIFIVEQKQNQTFNRGKLMNIGFLKAIKDGPWNCFIFHDVDLLPENPQNIYSCKKKPTHFSSAINKFNYSLPYEEYFGGVTAMSRSYFEKLNGFSNEFWGWGGEDDELLMRIKAQDEKYDRVPAEIGRYKMFRHNRDKGNEVFKCRHKRMNQTINRFHIDGINNVKYLMLKKEKKQLYTYFLVDLLEKQSKFNSSFVC